MNKQRRPTAIDLYSGIGGWTLGLQMAGIDVKRSYEWWPIANATHEANFGSEVIEADIRNLDLAEFGPRVDLIVGSPPCTQFSYANRGGSGDVEDGLRDIRKFLSVVAHLSPRGWALENVPRVAGILERELKPDGSLAEFASLVKSIVVVDMADYGLPQSRKRMIAGSFSAELLKSYAVGRPRLTLGDVVDSFVTDPIIDPIYGTEVRLAEVSGREEEPTLDWEELRMNREAKRFHPVYNRMQFPDVTTRPARTVTATCTRVSRESIVIQRESGIRRLTLRERASLQGFPINFQFPAGSYSEALTLVGNAAPPPMTYFVAAALNEILATEVHATLPVGFSPSPVTPPKPDAPRRRFGRARRFRAAIPSLRFGSGMRFELNNGATAGEIRWRVPFHFGPSKSFGTLIATREQVGALPPVASALASGAAGFARLDDRLRKSGPEDLQGVWTGVGGSIHPYDLVDELGKIATTMIDALDVTAEEVRNVLVATGIPLRIAAAPKTGRHASAVIAGLAVAAWFNSLPAFAGELASRTA